MALSTDSSLKKLKKKYGKKQLKTGNIILELATMLNALVQQELHLAIKIKQKEETNGDGKKGISIDGFSCFDVIQETNVSITGIPHKANAIPLLIIGGVMLLQGIMKGMGDSAAAKAANDAKLQAQYHETMRTGQSNGKAVFESARNTALQMSRNQNIAEAAYLNKQEGETKARDAGVFKQNELSRAVSAQNAAMQNVQAGKNIGSSSGSARAMAIATSLNAMKASSVVSNNLQNDLRNVQAGFKNQMSQQTFNVYIPNMDAPPNPPALASTSAPLVSGIVGEP